ncbi:MAG: methionyl-tRNA formyltransferase [Oscillospiraceae bacterium]|nr:methionyl-tRNA formyltransferase [Oscillospiraceae bacterium]
MSLRVAFFGTPDFAATCLTRVFGDGHTVVCAVTQPDKPSGRGNKFAVSAVKSLATGRCDVYQPTTLRDGEALRYLENLAPDIIVAVAYGKILPHEILALPKLGCVNVHASLLPKYRGSAPIQRAVLNGERETGVCSMYMDAGLDTGDVIFTRRTAIGDDETSGELFERLAILGADTLSDTLAAIERGDAPRTPQNNGDATYALPIEKSEAPIDWSRASNDIVNHVRGMNPKPTATAVINGEIFKVFKVSAADGNGVAGTVLAADARGITVACGDGAVTITELQAAGGKRLAAADYLRGHKITLGEVLR